jgi:poly(3-hydroxybutyrate) depolymerase
VIRRVRRALVALALLASAQLGGGCARHAASGEAAPGANGTAEVASVASGPTRISSPSSAAPPIAPAADASSEALVDAATSAQPAACVPRGESPQGYEADAVEAPFAFDLRAGVRVHEGDVVGGERPALDDAAWATVDLPAYVPASPARGARGALVPSTFWLRRRFTVAKGAKLDAFALDAGGRAGESTIYLNGARLGAPSQEHAPYFAPRLALREGENVLAIRVHAPAHVGGLRTYGELAIGPPTMRRRGLVYPTFHSAVDGSEQPLAVYLPTCVDLTVARPLLVALPGWSGNVHVFSHSRLLREAERRGWIVVVPDPRGNRLYTGRAELGVLEAIDRARADLKIDDARVWLTGVSMGGAGALQLGYHFPDRFAAVAAYYGDSEYDLASYVGPILQTRANADRYSVLRFPANARDLPLLLIHAKDDRVSAFAQSKLLADADVKLGLAEHRLLAPESGGHSLALVEETIDDVVALFARSVRPVAPARVSFATGSASYPGAYWLGVTAKREGAIGGADAELDVQKRRVTIHRADAAVARVTVDVARAGVKLPISLVVEKCSAELAIAGLAPAASVSVTASGAKRTLVADARGVVTLGVLADH